MRFPVLLIWKGVKYIKRMKVLNNVSVKNSLLIFSVVFLLVLTGCKTVPHFAEKNYPGLLRTDGSFLVHFNLSKDRILLDQFISNYSSEDLSFFIDRTQMLSISLDGFTPESRYTILAEGNYPKNLTNIAMGQKKVWVRHKDTYTWWENSVDGQLLSVPIRSVAIISNTDIDSGLSLLESGTRNYLPDAVKAEFENSAVTLYSHNPGVGFYKSLKIPAEKMLIQSLFFVVNTIEDNYSIYGVLDFQNTKDAKIFSTALKLGLLIKLRETGKKSLMKIVHDGRIDVENESIIMDNIFLNTEEITSLLSLSGQKIQEN